MGEMRTIGLDLAKDVFQVHGLDAEGKVLVRRRLRRAEVLEFFASTKPCLVGMEACASARHWAREIARLGHEVRLMPPAYVKPYIKRGKTDAADAEAIAEAVTRPTMRFAAVKTAEQQSALMLHKTRDLLVRQRTALINALRGHLGELGIVAPQGARKVPALVEALRAAGEEVPALARRALDMLAEQLGLIEIGIRKAEAVRTSGPNPGLAPGQRGEPTIGDDPRRRPDHRGRHRRRGARRAPVRLGPAVRGLARPDAEAAEQRRQGAPRPRRPGGQRPPPAAAGDRHDRGAPPHAGGHHPQSVGCQAPGAQAGAAGDGRARQQDRAGRLGGAGARPDLRGASRVAPSGPAPARRTGRAGVTRSDDGPVRPGVGEAQ
jgi:transposase